MSNGDTMPTGPDAVRVTPQPKDERVVSGQSAIVNPPPTTKGGKGGPAYIAEQLWQLAVPIDTLTPDPANARKHGEKNVAAIRASLSRFGQRAPIVVQRQGMVIRAGNGRWLAAKAMGWTQIAAVVVDDSSIDAVAFAIADNRTAELAEWDNEVLANLLNTMPEEDMADTGFDEADLNELLSELTPEVVEDEAPEAKPNPVSKTGDLWEIGEHRLLCGDSTSADDVKRLMGGVKAGLMVTDPPYGVAYDGGHVNKAKRETLQNDDNTEVFSAALSVAMQAVPSGAWYVWHAGKYAAPVYAAIEQSGYEVRALIIWNKLKAHYGAPSAHYCQKHEPCLYAVCESAGFIGPSNEVTVWDIDQPSRNEFHPTQKPIECMARAIRNHDASAVFDPFLGSGTTLIAAEQLGRKCYGMEISPQYCDVIVTRWEKLTGKKATCNGKTIEQLAEERGVVV